MPQQHPVIRPSATLLHAVYIGRNGFGIASFVIAMLVILWECAIVFLLWSMSSTPGFGAGGDAAGGMGAAFVILGLLAMGAGGIPAAIGAILGIVAVRRRYQKRRLAIIALVLNLLLAIPLCYWGIALFIEMYIGMHKYGR